MDFSAFRCLPPARAEGKRCESLEVSTFGSQHRLELSEFSIQRGGGSYAVHKPLRTISH